MELEPGCLQIRKIESLVRLTLNNSSGNNTLNASLIKDLSLSLQAMAADPEVRLIVLDAMGPHFCQGMQLDFAASSTSTVAENFRSFYDCLLKLYECPKPIIACVDAQVTGGGVGLVAACDVVLAGPKAQFILPEVIWGLTPALIVPFLSTRVLPGKLNYLIQSTRNISGSEAAVFGLVDEYSEEQLDVVLMRQMKRIYRSSPKALADAKVYTQSIGFHPRQVQESAVKYQEHWFADTRNMSGLQHFHDSNSPPWFAKPPQRRLTDEN